MTASSGPASLPPSPACFTQQTDGDASTITGSARTERSSSARGRRNGNSYSLSKYGRIEPIEYKLEATRSPTGQRICSFQVFDYSLQGSILERISQAMLLSKRRFVANIDDQRLIDADDPGERPPKTVAQVTRFNREAKVNVTVVAPRCYRCDREMAKASDAEGFATRYTWERWKCQCGCPDEIYRYSVRDYGWTPLRLWQHLVQRAQLRVEEESPCLVRGSKKFAHAGTEPKAE